MNSISEEKSNRTALPGKGHYSIDSTYFHGGRIHSYAHQIETTIQQAPARVLEVGKGPGMVAAALHSTGIEVITLDMQAELEPDLVGSVTQIPSPGDDFDVALCCQVLEHLPFNQFILALNELHRVTRNALVLSLPDQSPHYTIKVLLPKSLGFSRDFSRPRLRLPFLSAEGPGRFGHFWEVGCKGTTLKDVCNSIESSPWKIEGTWRVPEMPWHRFFLLKSKTKSAPPLPASNAEFRS